MGTLYILYSPKLNRYYIGSTRRFNERFLEHQRGQTISTKNGCPWQIMLTQNFPTYEEAHSRELKLKRWKNTSLLRRIISDGSMTI